MPRCKKLVGLIYWGSCTYSFTCPHPTGRSAHSCGTPGMMSLPVTSGVTPYPTPFGSLFQAGKPRPGGGGAVLGPMGERPAPSQPGRPGNRNPQPCKPPSHGVRRAAHCVPARANCAPAAATLCACRGTRAFPGREWGTGGWASGSLGLSPPCPCLSLHICWSCFGPSPRLSVTLLF